MGIYTLATSKIINKIASATLIAKMDMNTHDGCSQCPVLFENNKFTVPGKAYWSFILIMYSQPAT